MTLDGYLSQKIALTAENYIIYYHKDDISIVKIIKRCLGE